MTETVVPNTLGPPSASEDPDEWEPRKITLAELARKIVEQEKEAAQ